MQITDAPDALRSYLRGEGLDLDRSADADLVLCVVAWYEGQRATDAMALEDDGDMLLFQWGTYDWGEGPSFEYDMTRQFVAGPDEIDDHYIWQLSLTRHYGATAAALALGSGNRWCSTPVEAEDFRKHIIASPATAYVGNLKPIRTELILDRV